MFPRPISRFHATSLALLLAAAGCVSTPSSPIGKEYVHVNAAGVITYRDATCTLEQLPARLAHSGVSTDEEIRIYLPDVRDAQLRGQLTAVLARKMYRRILFLSTPHASSEVEGNPGSHTDAPVTSSPTFLTEPKSR